MEIWMIRHGDKDVQAVDVHYDPVLKVQNQPLNQLGRSQAAALANRLGTVSFDRIVSSDLIRASETAGYLAGVLALPVELDPRFREIDMGALNRETWAAHPKEYEEWKTHESDLPYPDGESGTDVWNRCRPALEELNASQSERIAVFCHGGVIRCVVSGVLGLPQQNRFHLGLPPVNTGITILVIRDGIWNVHTFNDYSHLSI